MKCYEKLLDASYGDIATCNIQRVLLWEMYKKMNLIIDEKIKNPLPVFHPYHNMEQIVKDLKMNCEMALAAGQYRRKSA